MCRRFFHRTGRSSSARTRRTSNGHSSSNAQLKAIGCAARFAASRPPRWRVCATRSAIGACTCATRSAICRSRRRRSQIHAGGGVRELHCRRCGGAGTWTRRTTGSCKGCMEAGSRGRGGRTLCRSGPGPPGALPSAVAPSAVAAPCTRFDRSRLRSRPHLSLGRDSSPSALPASLRRPAGSR